MSLHRRRLNEVHPYVADRINYILDYADWWGPTYSVISGFRTAEKQWDLYRPHDSVAARPGCSQHQYGLAADVWFDQPAWRDWFSQSARNFGLYTVANDPAHVQAVQGARFREWAESLGLCPDPNYPERPPRVIGFLERECGPDATSIQFHPIHGKICNYADEDLYY